MGCGPITREPQFYTAYARELFHTPNIHTVGWVDNSSQTFRDVVNSCVGLVYPSCSEGGGASAIVCLHAGLIPIVTRESSVRIWEDYGIQLRDDRIETIQSAVREVADLPTARLHELAANAWTFARAFHTRERYANEYRAALDAVLAERAAGRI